jgi:hypothetical protein
MRLDIGEFCEIRGHWLPANWDRLDRADVRVGAVAYSYGSGKRVERKLQTKAKPILHASHFIIGDFEMTKQMGTNPPKLIPYMCIPQLPGFEALTALLGCDAM